MSWQPVIAGLIVAAAMFWLFRKIYGIAVVVSKGGQGYVSSCTTCSKNRQGSKVDPLIQLDSKPKSAGQTATAGSNPDASQS